mgnify:FL=1
MIEWLISFKFFSWLIHWDILRYLIHWNEWHWFMLGSVLLVAEIAVPGMFLLWWGLAVAVIAGVMKLILPIPLFVLVSLYIAIILVLK